VAIDYLPLFDCGIPVLVSCRGSQVNVAPHHPGRGVRKGLPATFARAARIHCISHAIEREAERFGLDRETSDATLAEAMSAIAADLSRLDD
ncbi:hypothetical protein NL529_28880, partial [Klebsiella pneumoniae]|nr:hypothetical protein [Klebsiella pneumoniae]